MAWHNDSFILLNFAIGLFIWLLALRLITLITAAPNKEKNVLISLSTLMLGNTLWALQVTHSLAFPFILKTGFSLKIAFIAWLFAIASAFIFLIGTMQYSLSKKQYFLQSTSITIMLFAMFYFNIQAMQIVPTVAFSSLKIILTILGLLTITGFTMRYFMHIKYQAHLYPLRKKVLIGFGFSHVIVLTQLMLDQTVTIAPNAYSFIPVDFDSLMIGFKIGLSFVGFFVMPFIIAIFYDKFKFNTYLWRQLHHPYAIEKTDTEHHAANQPIDKTVLANDLRELFSYDTLALYFQLTIDSHTRTLTGAEAFLRWEHPTKGLLVPDDFMPLAESLDMHEDIDAWVIEESCRMLHRLKNDGIELPLSVNLSQHQLKQPDIVKHVSDLLKRFKIPNDKITFEIPESIAFNGGLQLMNQLTAFKSAGLLIAIDDFGTQSATLANLQSLPVSTLKLGPALSSDIASNEKTRGIVQAVIDIAHVLGLTVVAENVETEAQRQCLTELGCDQMQGFLISPPLPAHRFLTLIQNLQVN